MLKLNKPLFNAELKIPYQHYLIYFSFLDTFLTLLKLNFTDL